MEKEINKLKEYIQNVIDFTLPSFKELPGIDLYMEQVLTYINQSLENVSPDGEKMLTSFMVNNYVKAKMVAEPQKKKYSKVQIGYLLAITLCKTTISMADMSLLLELDHGISDNVSRIYEFWSRMERNILKDAAVKVGKHLDSISKRFEASKDEDLELARANARDALGLLALRLAIQAQANKLLSESIINALRKDMHGEDLAKVAAEPSKKETKHENRQDAHAAYEPRPLSDVLLDQFGSDQPDECGLGGVGNSLGHEGLTGSGRTYQEDSLRRFDTHLLVEFGPVEGVLDGLAELQHLFGESSDVVVCDVGLIYDLGPGVMAIVIMKTNSSIIW